jgi:uncharacterized protein with FMN-binding domain
MRRTTPILLSTALAAIPAGATFLGTAPLVGSMSAVPVRAAGAAARTVQGPSASMRWGPVQVTIIVQGRRIMDIKATAPVERARSAIINNRAIPLLRQEALRAQAANVQIVSGATMTSKAFAASLQAAIKQARL